MNMQVVSSHWTTNKLLVVSLFIVTYLIDGIISYNYDSYLDYDPCYGSLNYPIFVPHSIIFRLLLRFLITGLSLSCGLPFDVLNWPVIFGNDLSRSSFFSTEKKPLEFYWMERLPSKCKPQNPQFIANI
ncbi:hypothetical protein QQP08_004659 [Theobroma cacao]|nr:hypothetical protein QQP08_004659 [Theobroma cacao]